MKNKANISNSSIDSAGIPKDYRQAISELIWNGFDAKATKVNIIFEPNEIDTIHKIIISDNGEGINLQNLSSTFGSFLDSLKRNSYQRSSYNRGKKGKGRFSFSTFAAKATWHTVYRHEGKLYEYDIIINKSRKDEYDDTNKKISKTQGTGTDVILDDLFNVSVYSFSSEEFKNYLSDAAACI